jgi:hypothetical protein
LRGWLVAARRRAESFIELECRDARADLDKVAFRDGYRVELIEQRRA